MNGNDSKTFFGFGLAPSMFEGQGNLAFRQVQADEAKSVIAKAMEEGTLVPCLNPSHGASIHAMRSRFGIDVPIPEKAPIAKINSGDSLVVMGISGLPRLEGRHEYTEEEVASARFNFSVWTRTE